MNSENMNMPNEEMNITPEMLSDPSSRRKFLTQVMAGAAAATALAVPASAFAASPLAKAGSIPHSDAAILNFALTLEHLESNFYQQAAAKFGTSGSYKHQILKVLRFDEESHVNGLTAALKQFGYAPVSAAPSYNFGNAYSSIDNFLKLAVQIEDTGVHAYLGQAGNIKTPALLLTAASIATVEARHTGAIRAIMHMDPTDGPFDKGLTKAQILQIVTPLIGR